MRKMTVELAGTKLDLSLSWKTMQALKDAGADPMVLATEAMKEAEAAKSGSVYESKVNFDAMMTVNILSIAHSNAGGSLSQDEVGELVMENGVYQSQEAVGQFLARLLGGKSAEIDEKKEPKTAGKSKPTT